MIGLEIEIKGMKEIKSAYARRPQIVKKHINDAISKAIFKLKDEAQDRNFQFVTPRQFRTGYLQRSFDFGIVTRDFFGAIGPTAEYAPFVHRRNQFMDRIARAAQPTIQRYFDEAIESITNDLKR
jgi:hypothetical protein